MKTCSVDGCKKQMKGHGFCQGHLVQFKKHGLIVRPVLGYIKKEKCSVDECNNVAKSNGLCRLHYERMKRIGNVGVPSKSLPAIERIMKNVSIDNNGCWNCSLGGSKVEYPQVSIKRKMKQVHKYVYEYFNGPIENNLFACHRCNNKKCCNPDHIYPATNKENIHDAIRDGLIDFSKRRRRKLTDEDVLKIRNGKESGVYFSNLFNVSNTTISKIRKTINTNLPNEVES